MKKIEVPEGYMLNGKGGFDPLSMVKDIDLERDKLVKGIVEKTLQMSKELAQLKMQMFEEIQAFVKKSAKVYGVKYGGNKGNLTFFTYDKQFKVLVAINDYITFDERLQIAKELIDQCIQDWSKGSQAEIQALVNDAFYVGKTGTINKERILGLRRLDITDKRWQKAMQAISDSIQVTSSKEYVRVYRKNEQGKYLPINLNIATL